MKNIATTECYAVPGSNNIIDTINPDTGLTFYYGRTEAEIQAKEPGAVRMTLDAWRADAIARQHTPITWDPSDQERYDDMLNVLPPIEWRGGAFCVGEPYDHDLETGEERYQAYWHRGVEYVASSRPVTRRELRAEVKRAGVTAQEPAPPERGLLTKAIRAALPALYSQEDKGLEAIAVVKFFNPAGSWTWYATEACARLSDGREVSLADADKILCDVRKGNDAATFPSADPPNHLRAGMSKRLDREDSIGGVLGLDAGREQSSVSHGNASISGIRLREDGDPSQSDEERLREAGGSDSGTGTRASASQWRDSASQERREGRRQTDELGADDARRSSTNAHGEEKGGGTVQAALSIEDVIFFGLVDGFEKELGYFSLSELSSVRGKSGLKIERDRYFTPTKLADLMKPRG
jgi:hypothetical protein